MIFVKFGERVFDMEFLKVILIIVACYYAFKFGIRLLMPFLMKKMAEKLMKKAQQQSQYRNGQGTFYYQTFGGQREQQHPKSDGKVKVDYVPPKEEVRKGPSTAGEFIDFEEVK